MVDWVALGSSRVPPAKLLGAEHGSRDGPITRIEFVHPVADHFGYREFPKVGLAFGFLHDRHDS
jgi:hypothetical protein